MNRLVKTKPARRVVKPATNGHANGKLAKRMYGAARFDRLTQDWSYSLTSANAEIQVSRQVVIARAQQLERDNTYMEKLLEIQKNNVIGHQGVKLQMAIQFKNGKADKKANDIIEAGWSKFCRPENFTVMGTLSGIEVQWLSWRAYMRDGGILLRKYRAYDNPFRWALEPIDISRLDHTYNVPLADGSNNFISFGIEMNRFQKPIAYHILTRHPGDVFPVQSFPKYRMRIPAEEIIPFWTTFRAGQFVMMPRVTSIMKRLNMLDKYDQAELTAAFVASCKGGFLEKTAVTTGNATGDYIGESDTAGNSIQEIEPAMIEELPFGVSFKPNEPNHPTDAYPDFVKGQLRGVSSGAGVPYNDLANDLEGVNYSSIRSGMAECREGYKCSQRIVIEKLMTPIFEEWLQYAIMAGALPFSMDEYDRLNKPCWKPRRWDYVDPEKDVSADIKAMEAGFKSATEIKADSDSENDFPATCQERAQDAETMAENGVESLTDNTVKLMIADKQAAAAKQAAAMKPVDKPVTGDGQDA